MSTQRSVIFDAVLAVGGLHEVDRLLADDAEDVAAAAEEADALADEHLRIPAADRRRIDEAVVVDVLDDERRSRRCGHRA